ncbi:MAG: hypothetical protein AVDCRST_MAG79-2305 [uncultured Thermoleophilia bacterium]|uniref:Uncharacterized protein n=1 Tax=uncultured Thermoleophilia bacterium TaxID=1497501 RepID=A0A6J4UEE0_9ACTN|nr:MAG: hypothetical protein AVDCRST_MAG79-2305 [uncultured Thermoleophilia bacterium]
MRPHTPDPALSTSYGLYDRLPPLERLSADARRTPGPLAPTVSADRAAAPERSTVEPAPAAGAVVEVRYGLDTVANVWVAQFFDGVSGEFVRSVPATRVKHQLAALRHLDRGVDVEA